MCKFAFFLVLSFKTMNKKVDKEIEKNKSIILAFREVLLYNIVEKICSINNAIKIIIF